MSTRRTFLLEAAVTVAAAAAHASTSKLQAKASDGRVERNENSKPLRLAIVGTGQISHRYLKPANASARVRFVATCARTLDSAKARATEYDIDAWFDDYLAMYDTIRPDAVIVTTPTAMHAPVSMAAFERGIHVLCEKPMATTLEGCRAMVAAANRSGVTFLSLPFDGHPSFLAALEHLNEATLGVFTGAEAQVLLPGVSRDNWYYDRKIAGGGAGLDTLVYPVSALISMLGPAKRVTGFVNTLIPHRVLGDGTTIDVVPPPRSPDPKKTVESTVDDNATLVIEWSNGQHAVVRALWGTSIFRNDSTVYGRHGTLWVSGNDVVIHSPEKAIPGTTPTEWGKYTNCYRVPVQQATSEGLLDHFADCIEGRAKPRCGGEKQLHVHEILFKGYAAGSAGRTQDLETTFSPLRRIDPSFHDTHSRFI